MVEHAGATRDPNGNTILGSATVTRGGEQRPLGS